MRRNEKNETSRAEGLRQRRSQASQQQIRGATQRISGATPRAGGRTPTRTADTRRAATPTPSRPVVVRNATFGMPIHRQVATTNPRRTYYVALSSPGTEMRLPAIPTIRPGWRLLSATIALLAGIGLFSLVFSPFFRIGALNINGLERLTLSEIEAVVDIENLSIVEANPVEIKEQLIARFPGLESVEVQVSLPTSVTLNVKERAPVMVWKQGDDVQWIDQNGVIFPPNGEVEGLVSISSPEKPPVVLAQTPVDRATEEATAAEEGGARLAKPVDLGPARLDPTLFETAMKLATHLPAGTPLVFLESEGLGWEAPSGCDIFVGSDLSRLDVKIAAVQVIEEKLSQQGISAELINARNLDAPYYRVEQ